MQPHERTRFEQFSDGVFAIAITLLAIEIPVPELRSIQIKDSFYELLPLIPHLFTFFLSFVTIAIFWVNHHQLTKVIDHTNRRMLWSNVLLLMFVTLIPFATSAMSENVLHPLAFATYSFVFFAGSLSFTLLRYFVHKKCEPGAIAMRRSIVGPVSYCIALITSFISIWVALIFLIVPPLYYFLPKPSRHDNTSKQ